MAADVVVGANWGDEGKGKITDFLAGQADLVVRFQGGRNAGHTIINDYGRFVLHLLPSGVFHQGVVNVLATGVALDIQAFIAELAELRHRGIPEPEIRVSDRAQVVMPYHILFDKYEEERLSEDKFGSTQSGIAPFYSDKYLKVGVQVADLYDRDHLLSQLTRSLSIKNTLLRHLYKKPLLLADEIASALTESAEAIRPFVCDTMKLLNDALDDGKRIVCEGQLGALRDPDHGIYPFSTSSSPLAGFASVGAGIPSREIRRVVAVTKAYSSCVGAGLFVAEMFGCQADTLREKGGDSGEYGATTGRPRRVGYFDAVATRYGCRLNGATELALSCLDVLGYLSEIPICVAYEIDGQKTKEFPTTQQLRKAKPVLRVLPGWQEDISKISSFADLPKNAKQYIRSIEKETGFPVGWVSLGPHRNAMLRKDSQ